MRIQPVSYNFYSVSIKNSKQNRGHSNQLDPSFTGDSYTFYGRQGSALVDGDIYGNAVIDNLAVKNRTRSFFFGESFPSVTLHGSTYARRIYQPNGETIYTIQMEDNSKIGKVECDVSEFRIRGYNTVDEIKSAHILDIGSRNSKVKIGKLHQAHSVDIGGDCVMDSANTGFFKVSSIGVKSDIRVKDVTAGKLCVSLNKEDNLHIDNLTIDMARKRNLTERGFDASEYFTGNVSIDSLKFINGFGELRVTDASECLPKISKNNVQNGKLIFSIKYMKNVDEVYVDELNVLRNSSVDKARVKDVARISDSARIKTLIMTGRNAKVFLADSAKVDNIIFEEEGGEVYLVPTNNSYPLISYSKIQGGGIVRM